MPSLRPTALPILLLLAGACSTLVVPGPEAERAIARAEAAVASGEWGEVDRALAGLQGEACPRRLRDRRDLATARAHLGRGDRWAAYQVLERFVDDHPHSDLRQEVGELVWQIGAALAESDGGFLFFWSDRRAGRTALEHLITRHPDSPHGADALRILGDMAFEDEDYPLAQVRYRDLMLNHPEGEWFVHAQFRFAMSIVLSLEGPDYDLDRMDHATRELRQFLATRPEHPTAVAQAEQALAQITEWRADRHLRIAAFYRRVGNEVGYRQHLEIAAGSAFDGTTFQVEARRALAELEKDTAPGARP